MNQSQKTVILTVENGRAVCPVCGWSGQLQIDHDTSLINFPYFCKKCKNRTRVSYKCQGLSASAD